MSNDSSKDYSVNRNVYITYSSTGNSFSQYLSLSFVPDVVIVKGINWYNNGVSAGVRMLKTDLVTEGILAIYNESTSMNGSNGRFTLEKAINGNINFQITDVNGALVANSGSLAIHLEFIKY